MFAIVATSGKQYRVEPGATIVVDRIEADVGDEITLEDVLLVSDKDLKIGQPTIEGAKITCKVLDHHKGDKVITFKYRRTRRSRRRVGFRASHTTLEISKIKA
jgi:large subunit ribosomal protein L21